MYKVIFSGDRHWGSYGPVRREIRRLAKKHGNKLVIIEGEADGLDSIAREVAHEENVHVAGVWALWSTRFRSAGPQRNDVMLSFDPNEVICFHKDISKSRGTKNLRDKAVKRGIPTKVVRG